MTKRYHSNVAPALPLSVAVTAAATTLQVTSTTGYPAVPFIVAIERGTANEEVCLCTAKTATTLTVTRGFDATVAAAHGIGAKVEHTVTSLDYRESSNTPMTTAERNALAGAELWDGMFITNTDTDTIERYNGTAWVAMTRSTDLDTAIANGTTGKADKTTQVNTGTGLTGGGDLSVNRTHSVLYGTTAGTAAQGNDGRLFDARTPTTHTHTTAQVTGLDTALADRASKAGANTYTGTNIYQGRTQLGDDNADITEVDSLIVHADTRNLLLAYTGGNLTTVTERNGTTALNTATLAYTGANLTTVTEVVDGKTITTTLNYTGADLTSVTRSVA